MKETHLKVGDRVRCALRSATGTVTSLYSLKSSQNAVVRFDGSDGAEDWPVMRLALSHQTKPFRVGERVLTHGLHAIVQQTAGEEVFVFFSVCPCGSPPHATGSACQLQWLENEQVRRETPEEFKERVLRLGALITMTPICE